MPRAFICHASSDREIVERDIILPLRQAKIDTWYSVDDIQGGSEWEREILHGLSRCDFVIVVISPNAAASEWVRDEVNLGIRARKPLFPVMIAECDPASIHIRLPRLQCFDFYGGDKEAIKKLIQRLLPERINAVQHAAVMTYKSPFQAPRLPEPFIERKKEAIEVAKLIENHEVVIIRGGLGGLGKSTLASQVVHDLKADFPDGVFWMRTAGSDVESNMVTLMASIDSRIPAQAQNIPLIAKANLLSLLLSNRKALFVFDNVESSEEVEHLIPANTCCRFLLTSRYGLNLTGAKEYPLSILTDEAGAHLLSQILDRAELNEIAIYQIVKSLGALPLAISMAGAAMRDLQMTEEEYLRTIENNAALTTVESLSATGGIQKSFEQSYRALTESAKELFRAFSVVDKHAANRDALVAVLKRPEVVTLRDLALLVRRGLVTQGKSNQSFSIHPLLGEFAAQLVSLKESQQLHQSYGEWCLTQIADWDQELSAFGHGRDVTKSNIEFAASAYRHFIESQDFLGAQRVLVGFADPMTRMGWHRFLFDGITFLSHKVSLDPWLKLYLNDFVLNATFPGSKVEAKKSLEELGMVSPGMQERSNVSSDPKLASSALICLAKNAILSGQLAEAEDLLTRSQRLKLNSIPQDLKGCAYILNELARIRLTQGHPIQQAMSLHTQALALVKKADDNKGIAYTQRLIGSILLRRVHDLSGAISALQQAEAAARKCGSTFVLIEILLEQAEALRQKKMFSDAIKTVELTIELAQEISDARAEMHALKRAYRLFESVELYGHAMKAIERAIQLSELASFFETYDLNEWQNAKSRITRRIDSLRAELMAVELVIKEQETQIAHSGSKQPSAQYIDEVRSKLRVARKRRKRIRQRLGEEAAQVRIDKNSRQLDESEGG